MILRAFVSWWHLKLKNHEQNSRFYGRKGLNSIKIKLFQQRDIRAYGQLFMLLVARDYDTLMRHLDQNKHFLFKIYDEHITHLIKNKMSRGCEQKEINRHLWDNYGWQVRVQHDYFIGVEGDSQNVVWLRRFGLRQGSYLQRWLLVHWIETGEPTPIREQNWVVDVRNELTGKYYKVDMVTEGYAASKAVNLNGRWALQVDGLWHNDEQFIGGPFRTRVFYQESDNRIYFIGLAVFAPGQKKLPQLRQLDIMAHTFEVYI